MAVVWNASILLTPAGNPSQYEFLREGQIETIKELESLCARYSATSKLNCVNTVESEITRYQIDGTSNMAINFKMQVFVI